MHVIIFMYVFIFSASVCMVEKKLYSENVVNKVIKNIPNYIIELIELIL